MFTAQEGDSTMNFIKWLLVLIAVIVIAIGSFLFYMRFHDGPIEVFSGGPFQSGEVIKAQPDWTEIADLTTFEVQTLVPARSRTTWLAVVDGRLFIPSGYMNTAFGKIWKHWPHYATKDGRALLRVGNRIYEQKLVRVAANDPIIPGVVAALNAKYPGGGTVEHVETNDTWIFELKPR
tara:strand:- start:85693 stop:86226 length:534 start_codon:yes stop_codon:yes gene_type:complete